MGTPSGKGATLSLRKIQWPKVLQGERELEAASSDILHMGWNWVAGTPIITASSKRRFFTCPRVLE